MIVTHRRCALLSSEIEATESPTHAQWGTCSLCRVAAKQHCFVRLFFSLPDLGYVTKNFKSSFHDSFAVHFCLLKNQERKRKLAGASTRSPLILLLPVEGSFRCSEFRRMQLKFLVCFIHKIDIKKQD